MSLIETLGLAAHPEGGWFAETWRAPAPLTDAGALVACVVAPGFAYEDFELA